MIPNLPAAMAESPELLQGFLSIRQIFYSGTFSPGEIQVLALTNAFENGCRYGMALHSTLALKEGISKEAVEALRAGRSVSILPNFAPHITQCPVPAQGEGRRQVGRESGKPALA